MINFDGNEKTSRRDLDGIRSYLVQRLHAVCDECHGSADLTCLRHMSASLCRATNSACYKFHSMLNASRPSLLTKWLTLAYLSDELDVTVNSEARQRLRSTSSSLIVYVTSRVSSSSVIGHFRLLPLVPWTVCLSTSPRPRVYQSSELSEDLSLLTVLPMIVKCLCSDSCRVGRCKTRSYIAVHCIVAGWYPLETYQLESALRYTRLRHIRQKIFTCPKIMNFYALPTLFWLSCFTFHSILGVNSVFHNNYFIFLYNLYRKLSFFVIYL